MFKKLWIKYLLLLLAVSVVALSAALLLRELMVKDFREYLEAETEDRVYWVTAALESTFERSAGWDRERMIEDTVWALMLGFTIRLYDADGSLVMDTERAIETLSPLVKKRVIAVSEQRTADNTGKYLPYTLFLGGVEIGKVEIHFLRPARQKVFIERSNRFLLISLLVLGGTAFIVSIIFSKRLTQPLKELTDAVTAISSGDLTSRVPLSGKDEIAKLSEAFNKMAHTLEIQESLRKKITANIAHELRTPITAVRGELEGMTDGFIPVDREHLQSLYDEIGRFKNIIEGIEELSQAEASSLSLNKRLFEIKPFLRNILERFKRISQDKGVTIDLTCPDELLIKADPDKLTQIMINLLTNALKATGNGGSIGVTALEENSHVVVEVADNGSGIKDEDLPFIFERFYKAAQGGLGLGLTIVKELIDAHGGTITVHSEYGKGTTATLSFPL